MSHAKGFALAALSLAGLLLASQAVNAGGSQITVTGSTTLQPVVARIAREFMKDVRGTQVSVAGGGSGAGIEALLRSETDLANSSRFISEQELDQAVQTGIYPVPFRIADDCIIPVVHKSNRVKNLSLPDLKRIYLGEITSWKELGGADRAIEVISRSQESGTYDVWHDIVMGQEDAASSVTLKSSSANVVRTVSGSKGAIGYISLGYLSASVKPLRVDGVMGSLYTVRDGSYVLSRPLFMFSRGWPNGSLLQFINYALNPDRGQNIVRKMGFIPAHIHEK